MPGPGNRNKGKIKTRQSTKVDVLTASRGQDSSQPPSHKASEPKIELCMTLDEDEITRCENTATEGYPRPERCKLHHEQYKKMYGKYKDASKIVDEVAKGGKIPTKTQIEQYTDVSVILDKRRYLKRYIEAIRVERTGRDIHSRRFFLKVDDGHKLRLKILTKEMIRGVEALDGLEARAYKLHFEQNPLPDWAEAALSPPSSEGMSLRAQLLSADITVAKSWQRGIEGPQIAHLKAITAKKPARTSGAGDEEADLIDLELVGQKANMLHIFDFILDPETVAITVAKLTNKNREDPQVRHEAAITLKVMQQYALRIIFYEPVLYAKAEGKVSLKDLILSDDFSMEDMIRFSILFGEQLGFGLLWMKDSVIEALSVLRGAIVANIGDLKNRIKVLDGWIYNVSHNIKTSNEAWITLIRMVGPVPANIENRFVRLCNSFDDMISVLSCGALWESIPPPSFCAEYPVYRKHLSLSGVAIADMISSPMPPTFHLGMAPTTQPARRGYRKWAQVESRGYMFGAIRNESDAFTEAFLKELKSRPDLFQVITRSETDPGQKIEVFGPAPPEEDPIPQSRYRNFEIPSGISRPDSGHGKWSIARTAKDILYSTDPKILGYLTILDRGTKGWFFCFKKFKVKYIVIMDVTPNRHHLFLSQGVAWAALRAQGYAKGEYTERKYADASNEFFDKCAKERLEWLPAGSWGTTKM
ncbi:hypothetical protein BDN70DRAFT_998483 [Pholiota conissans]|uniref:Uncharacterized protein n=1 Tax=Pholiota conissans TaxID=109636 RepID=A0A9P5YQF1_9AGAR|nr:hypothetical protein BDN70DRAFT_998483 [Pholiota conissans]